MIEVSSNAPQKTPVDKWKVATICLIVACVAFIALAVWSFINYYDQKTNVDSKVSTAVMVAEKEQADTDEAKFTEREKEPNRDFVGPDDYGGLTFSYPKTWSVYVAKDASKGGTYEAYLNPVTVPTVSTSQQFALRITIEEKDYDKVIDDYSDLVESGDLKSSSFTTTDGVIGTRLDGNFSKDIRGSAVIFKIRDKTLTVRTDADTFKTDFDTLISTIKFNA